MSDYYKQTAAALMLGTVNQEDQLLYRCLNIQRNTFLARLERIMRILDLDLDDPKERLYMEISLLSLRT